jgi:hypothetical protein
MEKISRQRRNEGAWRDIVERQGPAAIWIPDYEPRFSHAYYIAPRPAVCAQAPTRRMTACGLNLSTKGLQHPNLPSSPCLSVSLQVTLLNTCVAD